MTLFVSCRRCHNTIKADDAEECSIGGCPLCPECRELHGYCLNHSDEEIASHRGRRRSEEAH